MNKHEQIESEIRAALQPNSAFELNCKLEDASAIMELHTGKGWHLNCAVKVTPGTSKEVVERALDALSDRMHEEKFVPRHWNRSSDTPLQLFSFTVKYLS